MSVARCDEENSYQPEAVSRTEKGQGLPDQAASPRLKFHVSRLYNLLHAIGAADSNRSPAESQPLSLARQELRRLLSYAPGTGLWGYFEEAMAPCQSREEIEESLGLVCQRLQSTILGLISRALPAYEHEWQVISVRLGTIRDELVNRWYPKEAAFMKVVADTFATPWPEEDRFSIDVHLLDANRDATRSRPLSLGVEAGWDELLLCDVVHELLHRSSFGAARDGLWAKLQLCSFAAGAPSWLAYEITHTVIAWAACTISTRVWGISEDKVRRDLYGATIEPQRSSLDAIADLWPAYEAGELATAAFAKQAVARISAATTTPSALRSGAALTRA